MHSVIYPYLFQQKIMSICMWNSLIAVDLFKAMYNVGQKICSRVDLHESNDTQKGYRKKRILD